MPQSQGRILLIEDDPFVRKLFNKKLSKEGYEIIEADDGKKGLRLVRTELPDLVITDIIMPDKEGIELITELRKGFPTLKIIAISGGGKIDPETYLVLAKTLGAVRTFTKPIDWPEMLDAVRALMT